VTWLWYQQNHVTPRFPKYRVRVYDYGQQILMKRKISFMNTLSYQNEQDNTHIYAYTTKHRDKITYMNYRIINNIIHHIWIRQVKKKTKLTGEQLNQNMFYDQLSIPAFWSKYWKIIKVRQKRTSKSAQRDSKRRINVVIARIGHWNKKYDMFGSIEN